MRLEDILSFFIQKEEEEEKEGEEGE